MYRLSCDCNPGPSIVFAGAEFRFACVRAAEQQPGVARPVAKLSCGCNPGPGILFAGAEFWLVCVSAAEQWPGVACPAGRACCARYVHVFVCALVPEAHRGAFGCLHMVFLRRLRLCM
jgi:hypothetical protein